MAESAPESRFPTWLADEPRLRTWRQWTDWPLTALAVLFLVLYATQVLYVSAPRATRTWLEATIGAVWALFVADYLVRLALAGRKLRFVRHTLFDLLVVVLPLLRQLRVLRVFTVIAPLNRRLVHTLEQRVAVYSSGFTALVGLSASLAVLDAERGAPDATITTLQDAMWWTLTTLTTVGYGDRYPVTTEGRLVAATLMVGGIALLGIVTGLVASWFVRMLRGAEDAVAERTEDVLRREISALRREVRALADQRRLEG
jgi:voltage-gated potassium channel